MRLRAVVRSLGELAIVAQLSAQIPVITGAGYTSTPLIVSPGQVITLHLYGATTILASSSLTIQASSTPWPTKLEGFSVTVQQGDKVFAAPLFSVAQTLTCGTSTKLIPQCMATALTVQIPFDLASVASSSPLAAVARADLMVNDNGEASAGFPIVILADNIHILTICDVGPAAPPLPSPCPGVVTHADGTMVSNLSPAEPGETVVMYGYGFGATTPPVQTGDASQAVASVVSSMNVQFDFRPNAGASIPYGPVLAETPVFVGLTPGQVGLYQLNVKIPDTVPSVPPCTVYFSCLSSLIGCIVQSNLTIDVAGVSSFDGAAVCVNPPQEGDILRR